MRKLLLASLLAVAMGAASSANAIALRTGMGGADGYGTESLVRNDDSFAGPLNMPTGMSINFFGQTYSTFYANNNGNISFNSGLSQFTPAAFPVAAQPMIAAYWGDVDTRCGSCGTVYVGSAGPNSFSVTYHDVGFYSSNASLTNDFQLTIISRDETGEGNFDIEFRYNRLQWTTGDASNGVGGLGGTPAQAGYDAGNGVDFFTLPGSRTADILDLDDTSNVSTDTPGLWVFNIRNGEITDGSTAATALVPEIVTEEGFHFEFDVRAHQRIFVDPIVATGYIFQTQGGGPNIFDVLFPVLPGQGAYQIWSLDGSTQLGSVNGGDIFGFGALGVSGFRVLGIDPDLGLDPTDPTVFVTGLSYVADCNNCQLLQTPITYDTDAGAIPEPATWALLIMGFLAVGQGVRIRRRQTALAAA